MMIMTQLSIESVIKFASPLLDILERKKIKQIEK